MDWGYGTFYYPKNTDAMAAITYEALQKAWNALIEDYQGKPLLQDCLNKAELFLSEEGRVFLFSVEDEKQRAWVN